MLCCPSCSSEIPKKNYKRHISNCGIRVDCDTCDHNFAKIYLSKHKKRCNRSATALEICTVVPAPIDKEKLWRDKLSQFNIFKHVQPECEELLRVGSQKSTKGGLFYFKEVIPKAMADIYLEIFDADIVWGDVNNRPVVLHGTHTPGGVKEPRDVIYQGKQNRLLDLFCRCP
jgi:hypothetical protein